MFSENFVWLTVYLSSAVGFLAGYLCRRSQTRKNTENTKSSPENAGMHFANYLAEFNDPKRRRYYEE